MSRTAQEAGDGERNGAGCSRGLKAMAGAPH